MKLAIAKIRGAAPYSQSRFHNTEKLNKELSDAYEKRTWRNKMHTTEDGQVYIPALAFKNCIAEAAKFLSMQVPGKGKSTYTKHFEAGVLVLEDVMLPYKKDEVPCVEMFVPSDGVRGSGKRVMRSFPKIPAGWEATVQFIIVDDTLTEDVVLYHLKQAGLLIGVGTFRVRNNGTFGRFSVVDFQWSEVDETAIGGVAA